MIKRVRKAISEFEVKYIFDNYINLGSRLVSKNLDRNINVINKKAKELGLIKSKEKIYYSRNEIVDAVKISINYSEVIKNLGLLAKGGNYKTVQKYIKLYDIDIRHFLARDYSKLHLINQKELNEILVKDSNFHRGCLKKRLFKEGLKNHICELCGQDENWNGRKMSLILDHINGINNDNRLENLRIVCPNCNATLDTHCGKNKAKEKREIRQAEHVQKVAEGHLSRRKVKDRPSIEVLKNDVAELGYLGTGRKYGVSDNCIRKWMK